MKVHESRRLPLFLAAFFAMAADPACFLDRSGRGTPPPPSDWEASMSPSWYCRGDRLTIQWSIEPVGCGEGATGCQTLELIDRLGSTGTTPIPDSSGTTTAVPSGNRTEFDLTVTHDHQPGFYTWTPKTVRSDGIPVDGLTNLTSLGAVCEGSSWSASRFVTDLAAGSTSYGGCVRLRQVCNLRNDTVVLSTSGGALADTRLARGDCVDTDLPSSVTLHARLEAPVPSPTRGSCGAPTGSDPQPFLHLTTVFDCDSSRSECGYP